MVDYTLPDCLTVLVDGEFQYDWCRSTRLGCGFFFQAEDGIRDLVRSRGLGDVYKRQLLYGPIESGEVIFPAAAMADILVAEAVKDLEVYPCLLYTSDAADDLLCVDLGGRRIIKKKTTNETASSETQP